MRISSAIDHLRKAFQRLQNALRKHPLPLENDSDNSHSESESESSKPQILAYHLLGEKTAKLLPLFTDLNANLSRSGINVSFKGYVSLTLLTTLLVSVSVCVIVPVVAILFFQLSPLLSLAFTAGATLFAMAFSVIGFYLYPIIKADSRKRSLEDGLPFSAGYLSILAGAGVPPAQMFRALARIDPSLAVCQEARHIVRDVELFGVDMISAIDSASKRTPSDKFKALLEGFIATMHSGGNLARYFAERSKQYMRLKKIALRRLGDTLAVLAEFYVVLLVAGPLIMVVMLAVMAMLGGGTTGFLNPTLLLSLLTYLGIPIGSIVFLIILDMICPKR